MIEAGLENGDLLIIDKSLKPKHGNIAVCFLDGDFTGQEDQGRRGEDLANGGKQ